MVKRILYSFFIILLFGAITAVIITYGRGYRFNLNKKTLTTTGILSVSSYPEKASIWIDGKLVSATNASVSLSPNWYNLRISKEGYQDWEKRVRLQGEIVSQVDALLVPTNPSLRALTTSGILSPVLSPDGTKAVYIVPSEEATNSSSLKLKHGVWIIEFKNNPLGGKSEPRLLYQPNTTYDWKNARIFWSSDEKQIILAFIKTAGKKETVQSALLIPVENNTIPLDITSNYASYLLLWQGETKEKERLQLSGLHETVSNLLSESGSNIRFSPDETKILYLATSSATLSPVLTLPIIGGNPTEETRKIEPNKFYIYDTKEDKNFFIADKKAVTNLESLRWYADSKHIVIIEKTTIYIIDYDGTNKRTVYTGPFEDNIVYTWPSGNRLVILTNLNKPNALPNFYEVDLR